MDTLLSGGFRYLYVQVHEMIDPTDYYFQVS